MNELVVKRLIDHGAILDLNGDDILLPKKFVTDSMSPGSVTKVFLYTDSEDRPVATTKQPKGVLGDFVALMVVDKTSFGAFLDWGLDKQLLVPNSEMEEVMEIGKNYVVKIVMDYRTNRLIGVSKIGAFFRPASDLSPMQKVKALLIKKTPLGFKTIVNDAFEGLLFENEVFTPVGAGDLLEAFVKSVREDGKIDLGLKHSGIEGIDHDKRVILSALEKNQGQLQLHDRSTPEAIKAALQMSKKAFKRAIGVLYKERKIDLQANKVVLIS